MKFDMYCVLHLPAFLTGKCHEISYVLRLPAYLAGNSASLTRIDPSVRDYLQIKQIIASISSI